MKPTMRVLIVSLLSISLTLALMLVLQANVPTALATGPWFVSPSGDNDNSCLSPDFACMTIQAAINKASSGDTIYIGEGTYYEHLDNGGKALSLIGDGAGHTIIDGSGTGRVFNDSSTSLVITINMYYLTIQNGNASSGHGGGIYAYHNLNLTYVDVLSNTSAYQGGGAWVANNANIISCRFENNWSTSNVYDGGALAVKLSLNLQETSFINNRANKGGGAIFAEGSANVENSNFYANRGNNYLGGAIYASSTLAISNTQFIDNRSGSGGGAIYAKGNVVVHRGYFYNNKATGITPAPGGGLKVENAGVSLYSTEIISNAATSEGSGLYVTTNVSKDYLFENSLFARNKNSSFGSAIYYSGTADSKLTLLHDTIVGPGYGSGTDSAMWVAGGTSGITNTIFTSYTYGIKNSPIGSAYQDYNLFYNVDLRTGNAPVGGNAHSRDSNPQFVDPANDNYHIRSGSAALDWGADVGVDRDYDGQPRPMGPGFDVGFDEFPLIYLPVILR